MLIYKLAKFVLIGIVIIAPFDMARAELLSVWRVAIRVRISPFYSSIFADGQRAGLEAIIIPELWWAALNREPIGRIYGKSRNT